MIIYLHGFSSAAKSRKALWLQQHISVTCVLVPDYPSHQPVTAIDVLKDFIEQHHLPATSPLMLIGSSLGGYYAQYLGATLNNIDKVVLINPALQPQQTLAPVVGPQTNMVTGEAFEFTRDDLAALEQYDIAVGDIRVPSLVLLDEADDIIDYRFAKQKYDAIGSVIVYPDGSHWFEHLEQALPKIMEFYKAVN
jgi:predicted esterase YcpF (UPF0227 family)